MAEVPENLLVAIANVHDALKLGVPCFSLMRTLRTELDSAITADDEETKAIVRGWFEEIFRPDAQQEAPDVG
jgi:hypothetical protein